MGAKGIVFCGRAVETLNRAFPSSPNFRAHEGNALAGAFHALCDATEHLTRRKRHALVQEIPCASLKRRGDHRTRHTHKGRGDASRQGCIPGFLKRFIYVARICVCVATLDGSIRARARQSARNEARPAPAPRTSGAAAITGAIAASSTSPFPHCGACRMLLLVFRHLLSLRNGGACNRDAFQELTGRGFILSAKTNGVRALPLRRLRKSRVTRIKSILLGLRS